MATQWQFLNTHPWCCCCLCPHMLWDSNLKNEHQNCSSESIVGACRRQGYVNTLLHTRYRNCLCLHSTILSLADNNWLPRTACNFRERKWLWATELIACEIAMWWGVPGNVVPWNADGRATCWCTFTRRYNDHLCAHACIDGN